MHVRRRCGVQEDGRTFQDASDAGGRLEVAYVALSARVRQRPVPALFHHSQQRAYLDRIPQGGPSAMAFNRRDVVGGDAGHAERRADHGLLRRPIGRGEARAPAILVGARARQARHAFFNHPVVFCQFEEEAPCTFPALVTVGGSVEREATPDVAQHAGHAIAHVPWFGQCVHAAAQRSVVFFAPSAVVDLVHVPVVGGHERSGARRVERHGGPLHVEHEGEACRDHRAGQGGRAEHRLVESPGEHCSQAVPIGADVPKVGADLRAIQLRPRPPG
mmetsp:Transcript_101275/g.309695  ORF Transcript_101275/g.309695 Transcript_101275/m.309695 type:complete len:275 (-) Transcript_101275:692-1516(-)